MKLKLLSLFLPLVLLLTIPGCGIRFTFSGNKVPEDVRTITIDQFVNNAKLVSPSLAQDFSEALRDFFLKRTNLRLVSSEADMMLTGEINRYEIAPINLTGDATAAQNRLSMSIQAKMESTKHPELAWSESFNNFADFDASANFSAIEKDLQTEITQKIAQDVFNRTFGQW